MIKFMPKIGLSLSFYNKSVWSFQLWVHSDSQLKEATEIFKVGRFFFLLTLYFLSVWTLPLSQGPYTPLSPVFWDIHYLHFPLAKEIPMRVMKTLLAGLFEVAMPAHLHLNILPQKHEHILDHLLGCILKLY